MSQLIAHISGIDELSKEANEVLSSIATVSYKKIEGYIELKNSLENCDIFWFRLNHKLTREVLENVRCAYILCAVTGLDHIDLDACEDFGIQVISLKGESEFLKEVRATAEHAIGLMLALVRKTKRAFSHTESKQWDRTLFQGTELYKKKIGIYGMGRLGQIVAQYAHVFGMEVYYYDTQVVEVSNDFISCTSPEELCSTVDILSIHLPYNQDTHFLIDNNLFDVMKPTISIINTARGGVVNENDLLNFLSSSSASYATDVLYGEPDIDNHPLIAYALNNENVIITPHIGGNTIESIEKTENFIALKFKEIYLSQIN